MLFFADVLFCPISISWIPKYKEPNVSISIPKVGLTDYFEINSQDTEKFCMMNYVQTGFETDRNGFFRTSNAGDGIRTRELLRDRILSPAPLAVLTRRSCDILEAHRFRRDFTAASIVKHCDGGPRCKQAEHVPAAKLIESFQSRRIAQTQLDTGFTRAHLQLKLDETQPKR